MRLAEQGIDKTYSEEVEKKTKFMKQRYSVGSPKAAKLLARKLRKKQAESSIYEFRDPTTKNITKNLEKIHKAFETYYKSLHTQPEKSGEQK